MKKVISLIVVLLVCVSLTCAVFADEFVPSVSYKGAPGLLTIKDAEGKEAIGALRDASGKIVSYVYADCLLLTPVAQAETSTEIPAAAKETLLSVYAALTDGTMNLPYSETLNADSMVIKDLFDLSLICTGDGHAEELAKEGVTLELVFQVDVPDAKKVSVMTYSANAWGEIAKVQDNGDGTITCNFEHLCPVAISVGSPASGDTGKTGDEMGRYLFLWAGLMVASAGVIVTMLVVRRKAKR